MDRKNYASQKRRRIIFKRVRGVILILLVLALISVGIYFIVKGNRDRHEAGSEVPTHEQEVVPGEIVTPPDIEPDTPEKPEEPDTPPSEPEEKPYTPPVTPSEPAEPAKGVDNPGHEDWRTVLVSAAYPLTEEYDIELTTVGNRRIDVRVAPYLEAFMNGAKEAGYSLQIISGHRTFAKSAELLENEIQNRMKYNGISREEAEVIAAKWVAPPGTSEHNTGLAVDVISMDYYSHHPDLEPQFENDPEAIWMKEHCAEYGFILRYPKDKTEITGIGFEPWHFRYVGQEIATYIMEHHLTLEEYLGVA